MIINKNILKAKITFIWESSYKAKINKKTNKRKNDGHTTLDNVNIK